MDIRCPILCTADELIEAYLTGELEYEEYPVHFPETGYQRFYVKVYNYTVTGKVISCHRYDGCCGRFWGIPAENGFDFRE